MAWILVTPSSRGIGAALTRHLLQHTPPSVPIVATTRAKDAKETRDSLLAELESDKDQDQDQDQEKWTTRLDVQRCDLLSESSIADLAGYCKDRYQSKDTQNPHLRLGFFLPGMLKPEKSPQQIEYDSALETLKLNLLTPMLLLKHFVPFLPKKSATLSSLPHLPDAAVLACMSARVGSITDNALGGWYSYRASKAGLNQVVKSTDLYVKVTSGKNACVVGLHPGTVKTGLSKEFWSTVKKDKLFSAEFAAEKLIDGVIVDGVVGRDVDRGRGRCWDWKGEEVPP